MADLRAALAGLSEIVEKLNRSSRVSKKNKDTLEGAETAIKAQAANVLKQIKEKEQAVQDAEQEVEKVQKELKKMIRRKGTDDDDDDVVDDSDDNEAAFMLVDANEYKELTATADRLQTDLTAMAKANKGLKEAMHARGAENRGLKTDINKGKTDLRTSKEELKNKGFLHEEELKEQEQEVEDQKAQIGRMQHAAKVQDARILQLNTELNKSKGDLTGMRGTLETRERVIKYWEKKVPAKEQEVERLEKEKATTAEEHKATIDDLEERRTKLIAEKGRLAEESEETIGLMKTELDKVKGEKGNLEDELKKAKEDLEESESTNTMLWKRVAKYEGAGAGADGESPASKRARTEGS